MNIEQEVALAIGALFLFAISAILLVIEFSAKGGQAGFETPMFRLSGSTRFVAGILFALVGIGLLAGPNWRAFMANNSLFTDEAEPRDSMVAVPDVRGQQEADGLSKLRSLDLEVAVQRVCSAHLEGGRILAVHGGRHSTDVLPGDDELTGQAVSVDGMLTVFVSDGVCSERHCSSIRPSTVETVRFAAGAEDGEIRVTLGPGDAVAYSLNVRAEQTIQVTATPGHAGAEHLICVVDPEGQPIAAGDSLRVTSPPLRRSGGHQILIQERSGIAVDYSLRFFIPAA
jgi:hypothetical protein